MGQHSKHSVTLRFSLSSSQSLYSAWSGRLCDHTVCLVSKVTQTSLTLILRYDYPVGYLFDNGEMEDDPTSRTSLFLDLCHDPSCSRLILDRRREYNNHNKRLMRICFTGSLILQTTQGSRRVQNAFKRKLIEIGLWCFPSSKTSCINLKSFQLCLVYTVLCVG